MRYPVITRFFCILLSFTATPVFSENLIYQWIEQNKTFFSDRPHADARVITLPETQSHYKVKRVVDGDTVLLDDGTKVRLLGINTPELANRHQSAEAGGKRAKQWLTEQLQGETVRLETDVEKTDKYGRTLAHLFTDADVHVNAQLVRLGLAAVSLYPPNLKYADSLIAAEAVAEKQRLGLWNDAAYALKPLGQLNPDNQQGWQRITGVVKNLRQSRQYYYLEFSGNFNARIHRSNAHLFPDFSTYVGQAVEVRGWINRQQGQLSMLIRHPDALRL
ncbi:MAG: nuclease [Methylococcaceae bacterium]|nr:nuclease [Methylococcaceae bacterium]